MVDTVTAQVLLKGPRHLVKRFTNVSDGTGESGIKKVDAAGAECAVVVQGQTIHAGVHLKVTRVEYDVKGMGLRIQWDASSPADMLVLGGYDDLDFRDVGGIQNPGTGTLTGSTGSILFTTLGAVANSSYSVVLHCTLGVPQS